MLLSIHINGELYHVQSEISILEACRIVGITVPRFCYHENLSIAGNCRMCLVEVNDIPKPVVACSTDVLDNMIIYTESPMVLKARESVLEFLLLNHPLDCPICDQAGECDLQDQAIFFGSNISRNYFRKRAVEDKVYNHLVKTIMVRCIHCTKCVRFGEEICGIKFFGTLNRGTNTEIGSYLIKLSLSEVSANVIDLCPVGALTLKSVPFQIRPWEVQFTESIDLSDGLGSNIYLVNRGVDIFRILPKKNKYINDSWISNKCRFYFDLMAQNSFEYNQKSLISFLSVEARRSSLFLINPDLDLKALHSLKTLERRSSFYSVKLLNCTPCLTNFFFFNNKTHIKNLSYKLVYTFFLITTNLQLEVPLLNIRIKSQILGGSKAVLVNGGSDSNFPIYVTRFSVLEVIQLFKGSHPFFSKYFFNTECIFFTNKVLRTSIDLSVLQIFKKKKIKYYQPTTFCNSESANILNIKGFNYKEFFYKQQILGLGLDDSFRIRKFLFFSQFFWVNKFSANLLSLLPAHSWLKMDINQSPGIYLNIEQRPQQFLFINTAKTSLLNFSESIILLLKLPIFKPFKSILCLKKIFCLAELKEVCDNQGIFNNQRKFFSFFTFFLSIPAYYFYSNLPAKLLFEDPYRTSLHLKYSRPILKSSQLLRAQ